MTYALAAYLYIMGLIASATMINPEGHGFFSKLMLTIAWPIGIPIELISGFFGGDDE